MGASSSQLREWYAPYRCNPSKFDTVAFPGDGKTWNLSVADVTVEAWQHFAGVMATWPYLFRESAGGTYNCRMIAGTNSYSLHSYGIALDLNPSKNPMDHPVKTDMPAGFRDACKAIKTNNNKQVFYWGGDWPASNPPDSMHWQINCSPADLATGLKGDDMTGPNGEPNWDKVSDWAQNSWTKAYKADLLTEDSEPQDVLEVEQLMVYLARAKVI
jgi:hypothetical protein